MPFPYLGEDQKLNETLRASAPGKFVSLPDGMTHYDLGGPENGRLVVLVHGFSVPYYIFDPAYQFLCTSGFHVLRYDLFGRGWSDRPQLPNNIELFVRQLHDLLAALAVRSTVVLAGLSMGGPISAAFTVRNPETVAANILIDPAGTRPVPLGTLNVLTLPVLGELVLGLFAGEQLVRNIASDFFEPALVEEFQERYRPQMRLAGFRRSILSTLRSGMLGDFSETYSELGKLSKPTLLLWGREDRTVPFAHSAELVKLLPHSEFHVIEHTSHIPHYERPEEVNPLLLRFLEGIPSD